MADTDGFFARRRREIAEEGHAVPFAFDELERRAREVMSSAAFRYTSTGAGTRDTVRANQAGFDLWRIVPRVFRGAVDRSLEVELFGRTLPAPVGLSPIGGQGVYHEEGEVATARAAASLGVPFTASTVASRSIEEVAEAGDGAPQFYQLYWPADWEVAGSLVSRAEAAGYDAVMVTVDFLGPRWTPESFVTSPGSLDRARNVNLATDPVAEANDFDPDRESTFDQSITWEDLGFLKEHTDLPVLVKGVVHVEDARLALEHGADGIVVSNHGGRQVDGSIGTVTALPAVVETIDGRIPVLLDGGVRTGADVFKAYALGADLVCVGRPFAYGLALAGERGAYEVIHNLLAELESVVGLSGFDDVRDVDRSALYDARD